MTHYDVLEVSPRASDAVIRAAYKSLMQRYHPDKNPGNAEAARHATMVVQAYEVLSDAGQRAAYDRELALTSQAARVTPRGDGGAGARSARRSRPQAVKQSPLAWLVWAVVGLVGVVLVYKNAPHVATMLLSPEWPPTTAAHGTQTVAADARVIPSFLTGFAVDLRQDAGRLLSIPVIGVRLGPQDPEHAARHLHNTAELIRQRLQEGLAEARFDDLLRPDGDRRLARRILSIVRTASGTEALLDAERSGSYGAVEILLPESYSVR